MSLRFNLALRRADILVLAACAGFFAMGMGFLPGLGIEADESLIANGIYPRGAALYSWHILGAEIPVMILSYLGAFKTWLYNALFLAFQPTVLSLRLPMLAVGAVSIWLFYLALRQIAGRRAGVVGSILLATDSIFILTEATDFGFVALQHLLKLASILLFLWFHRTGSGLWLGGAFFLLGLALWDKAVFIWVLMGLAVATVVIFPREVREHLGPRNCATGVLSFCLGAFPLLTYNIARPLETFRSNAVVTTAGTTGKVRLLMENLSGQALFGFVTAPEAGPRPGRPKNRLETTAFSLSRWLGQPRKSLTLPALAAAILLIPILWRTSARRPMLFALLVMLVTSLQMLITAHAGAATQHIVLLWPFQYFLIAIGFSTAFERSGRVGFPLLAMVAAGLSGANLAVANQYYVDFVRNGGGIRFTDAIFPLTEYIARLPAKRIFVMDWGALETVNLLWEGEVPVQFGDKLDDDPRKLKWLLASGDSVFVSHTIPNEFYPEMQQRLISFAAAAGFEKELLRIIHDRNGRAIFEVFRFRPSLRYN